MCAAKTHSLYWHIWRLYIELYKTRKTEELGCIHLWALMRKILRWLNRQDISKNYWVLPEPDFWDLP
jgi:hypothetical protein